MNLDKLRLNRCLASAIALSFTALPLWAADNEGSLDNMWKDQPAPGSSATATHDLQPYQGKAETDANSANSTPLDRAPSTAAATPATPTDATTPADEAPHAAEKKPPDSPEHGYPLETFLHSSIMLGSSWPNIGPFKTTTPGPYSLVDPAKNRIGLAVNDNKVVAAEFDLVSGANPIENFANLEMSTDFLLEALGSKPKKINDINKQMEANTAVVQGTFVGPLGMLCEPYVIMLNKGDATYGCKLRVSNKQVPGAESAQIAMADLSGVADQTAPPSLEAPPHKNPPQSKRPQAASTPAPASADTEEANPAEKKYKDLLSSVTQEPGITAPSTPGPRGLAGARTEGRKQEFLELIQSWQRLKKAAVRQRATAHLPEVLAGAALARQSAALKSLAEGHKYFDMTPKSVQVDRVEELTPDQKYYVYAQIKENSKYVDESSGQVIKESDDTYKVRYVVERADDRWVISDSALIKPTTTTPPQGSKPTH
jgi:hypothetical protein